MENLIARLRRTGFLVLVGIVLIIGAGLGFVYFQQGAQQRDLEEKIRQLDMVLNKELSSAEELRTEYDNVNLALAPLAVPDALEMLVDIARENGIDTDPASGKFDIPSASIKVKEEKVGGGSYQVLSFSQISVRGDYANVMAFISDLDSGETLETMVLKNVDISQTETETEIETEIETGTETETVTLIETETIGTLQVDIYTTKPPGGG